MRRATATWATRSTMMPGTCEMPIRDTHHRIELYLPKDEPMPAELLEEARLRGVSPGQHIKDLLQARYLARHGERSLSDLLWVPETAPGPPDVPIAPETDPEPPATTASANKAAGAWGRKR